MKKQPNTSFETMNKMQVEKPITTINETLDGNNSQPNRKLFTEANMWFIHRQGKTAIQRRHSF